MTPSSPALTPLQPDPAWSQAGLLLVGHGSRTEPQATKALTKLAADLRGDNLFAGVEAAFLAGGRPLADALAALPRGPVFVVPHFMSDGYFVSEKIPAELGLHEKEPGAGGKPIRYCRPPALHPAFPALVQRECEAALAAAGERPTEVDLLLVAHGSERNAASANHAAWVAGGLTGFRNIRTAFLEQAPRFAEALRSRAGPTLVAGLFAADGFHAEADVRAEIEAAHDGARDGPPIFATGALGAKPEIKPLVLAQVSAFDETTPAPLEDS